VTQPAPNPATIAVRPAVPPDAGDIARVHVDAWRAAYVGIVPQSVLDRLSVDRRREFWARRLADPGETRTFVADSGDQLVGFAGTSPPTDPSYPPGTAELETNYLLPETWRLGVGSRLMRAAIDDLEERGFSSAILWVLTDNDRGRGFYEAAGWQDDGRAQMLDFDGTPVEEIRYRLALGRHAAGHLAYHREVPAMTTSLPDHVCQFLDQPRFASIATVDEDGTPRQAVVWFLFDGDTLVINSLEGRRWPSNLRRDPRISIAVTDAVAQSWVGLTGTVEVIDDQEQAQADIAAMARRYETSDPNDAEALIESRFRKQRRVSFRLRPTGFHDHVVRD
jgi:PPOX class probable F420-dependent enzyme